MTTVTEKDLFFKPSYLKAGGQNCRYRQYRLKIFFQTYDHLVWGQEGPGNNH